MISKFKIKYVSAPQKSTFDFTDKQVKKLPVTFNYNEAWDLELSNNVKLKYSSKKASKFVDGKFYFLPDVNSDNLPEVDLEVLSSLVADSILFQSNSKLKLLQKPKGKGIEKKMYKYLPSIKLAYAQIKDTGYLLNYQINTPPDDRFSDPMPTLCTIFSLVKCPWPLSKSQKTFPFKNLG